MIGIRSTYVQATEGQVEGRVFPVEPGKEGDDTDVIRRTVDRCAENSDRGGAPPEMLGVFVATDTADWQTIRRRQFLRRFRRQLEAR